jgi:hypothetical protein
MPAKLTTTINKIETVPNPTNAEIIGQFYHYMKGNDVSENHQNNCLKVVITLANFLGTSTTFYELKAFKEADYNIKPATLNMGKVKNSVKEGDVKDIGHYSTGKTEIIIKEKSEISYVLSLINGLMKEVEV